MYGLKYIKITADLLKNHKIGKHKFNSAINTYSGNKEKLTIYIKKKIHCSLYYLLLDYIVNRM